VHRLIGQAVDRGELVDHVFAVAGLAGGRVVSEVL
jgi:hypothetical protein